MDRGRRSTEDAPAGPPSLPPRPEMLRQPDIQEPIHLAQGDDETEIDEEGGELGVYTAGRYRHRPSVEEGGPRWDPYAEEQSRAARVKAHRQARGRPRGPVEYTRWEVTDTPPKLTHYQLLGVQPDASIDQIERAYRRYAASIHPDKYFDDPEARAEAEGKLRELNAIMQTLRDPYQRARYDLSL